MIDSELTPQLYQTLPVENRELIPGVRAAIPRAVARRSTEDLREKRERAKMYKEDSRSFQQGSIFSAGPGDAFSDLILTVVIRNGVIIQLLKERCERQRSTGAINLQNEYGMTEESLQIA